MSDDAVKAVARLYLNQKGNNIHPWWLNNGQMTFLADHWRETKECIEEYLTTGKVDGLSAHDITKHLETLRKKKGLILEQADADRIYTSLIKERRYFDASCFRGDAGVPPSVPVLNELWKGFLRGTWRAHDLETVVGRFGKPAFTKNQVDRLCKETKTRRTRATRGVLKIC
jgi:predicted nucleotidyltransferase